MEFEKIASEKIEEKRDYNDDDISIADQVLDTVSSNFAPVTWSEACARHVDKMFRLRLTVPILCIAEDMERAA